MAEALAAGRLEAGGVLALMMHGTGTPLGDPIEVGAATGADSLLGLEPCSAMQYHVLTLHTRLRTSWNT